MLELFSLLGGGVLRLFPSFLDFFSKKRDLDHELKLLEKQMDLEKIRWQLKSEEIKLQSEVATESAWAAALPKAQEIVTTGVKWVDAMNASVRPVLTYWWCLGLYTAYKGITVYVAIASDTALLDIANVLVTEFDRSVIGSIIGFWFLDRTLRKLKL
jgi:hypothetical protein